MTRLCQLAEKAPHTDLRREMIACASERLMRLEYVGLTGAGYGEKSAERLVQRNGYRERDWQTRAVRAELRIPHLRQRSCLSGFLEPHRSAEKALTAVMQEACIQGGLAYGRPSGLRPARSTSWSRRWA